MQELFFLALTTVRVNRVRGHIHIHIIQHSNEATRMKQNYSIGEDWFFFYLFFSPLLIFPCVIISLWVSFHTVARLECGFIYFPRIRMKNS